MRIKRLAIPNFKNLKNLKLQPENDVTQILIGQNATGKSNLIEALVAIFRHLDLKDIPPFNYLLEYSCRGHNILVRADIESLSIDITDSGTETTKTIDLDTFVFCKRK